MDNNEEYRGDLESANIVMLGNSITYQGDWKIVLKRNDVFNGGQPGWTSEQLSWVIKDYIAPYKPKLCFFKAGINDLTLGIPPKRIVENIQMVLDSIKSEGTIPIFQTTLYQRYNVERNREIDEINAAIREFCKQRGYDFIDLRNYLCKDGDILDQYISEDNTHLLPAAYPVWGSAIKLVINKYDL
jgi:lysophospholipase L1-like esterase